MAGWASDISAGPLTIVGTAGADTVDLSPTNGDPNHLTLRINAKDFHYKLRPQNNTASPYTAITLVHVCGLAGDDKISLDKKLINSSWLEGGAGTDQIRGGSGRDVIFGGAGDDKLFGGDGDDVLIGGLGSDHILGEKGNDLLVAGLIDNHVDFLMLQAISHTWSSTRTVMVAAMDDLSPEETRDGTADQLTGGTGADLFFIELADKISDYQVGKPKTNKDGDVLIKDGQLTL